MRITAQLYVKSRPRNRCEVSCHDPRGTSVEREWRDRHASVSYRHEIGLANRILLAQQSDRIGTIRCWLPRLEGRPRCLSPSILARLATFVEREVLHLSPSHSIPSMPLRTYSER